MADGNGYNNPSKAELALLDQGLTHSQLTWDVVAVASSEVTRTKESNRASKQAGVMADHPINWEWIRAEVGGDQLDRYFADDVLAPEDRVIPEGQREAVAAHLARRFDHELLEGFEIEPTPEEIARAAQMASAA